VPTLEIPPKFERVARKKEARLRIAIARCVELLGDDPHHPGLHAHRVQGAPGVWEAYVDDANRVTFHYVGSTIVMRNNCNHDIIRRSP
jgi:hypothetical protein